MLLFGLAYSKDGEYKKSFPSRIKPQSNTTTQLVGNIKFEETFADSLAIDQWIIVNADSSRINGRETVGEFVETLVFPDGSQVLAQMTGTYFWASNFANAYGKLIDEWLISPELPVVEAGDTLSFFAGSIGEQDHDSLQILLSIENPQGKIQSFDFPLKRIRVAGPVGSWHLYEVGLDIPEAIGKSVWIALRYWHTDGGSFGSHSDNVWIDHISVVNNPTTAIIENLSTVIDEIELAQNYPNPFNSYTNITYSLVQTARVRLIIYNMLGQKVQTLVDNELRSPGKHVAEWNGRDNNDKTVNSGIYFYQLETSTNTQKLTKTKQMIFVK